MTKPISLRVSCAVIFIIMTICLGPLLSCEAQDSIRLHFPAEASLNKRLVHGDFVFLKLHFKLGEELWFVVDTGAPKTLLDRSLEPRLGKILGTKKIKASFFPDVVGHVYAAPQLYWGDIPLATADRVAAIDLRYIGYTFHPISGILGMDCLRHYCIQLDFPAGKIQFLDPDKLDGNNWGKSFPLVFHNGFYYGPVFTQVHCFDSRGTMFVVDTGCAADCLLAPKLFQLAAHEQEPAGTRSSKTPDALHTLAFDGGIYTNLTILQNPARSPTWNYIGLGFLEQHVVTFNFPKRTMFLKRVAP